MTRIQENKGRGEKRHGDGRTCRLKVKGKGKRESQSEGYREDVNVSARQKDTKPQRKGKSQMNGK